MPRVVHEDARSYRLDNGAVIAKAALSDAMHARIKGYAKGGVVSDGLSDADRAAAQSAADDAWALQMRRASGSGEPTDALPAVEVPPPAPVDPGSFQQMLGNPQPVDTGPASEQANADRQLASELRWDEQAGADESTRIPSNSYVPPPEAGTMAPLGVSDAMLRGGGGTVVPGLAPGAELAPLNVEGITPRVDLRAGNTDQGTLFDAAPPNQPGPGGLLALTAPFAAMTNGQPPAPPPAPTPSGESAPIPVAPASLAASAGQRSTTPRTTPEQPYREDPAQAQALRAQQVAIDGAAAIEKARLANAAQQEFDTAKALEERRADYERQRNEIQGRAERLANDVASGRLDPNRLWNKLDTGQRLGNAISLILGGIGSALAGGPNQALAVIEGAIDRDIESQKDERSRKEGLLQFHIQQGRDLTSAYTLAKADLLDIAAGKMRGAANRYGSMATAANALAASGALAQKAIELRAQGLERDLDGKFKRAQIAKMQSDAAADWVKIKIARGQQAASKSAALAEAAALAGRPILPEDNALLPPAIRNVMVKMPDGSLRAATGVIGKQTVEAANSAYSDTSKNLDEYEKIRMKWPSGWQVGVQPGEAMQDKAAAKALFEKLRFGIARMNEPVGILTEKDIERAGAFVPDITDSSIVFDTKARRLSELRAVLQNRMQAINDAHLVGSAAVPDSLNLVSAAQKAAR